MTPSRPYILQALYEWLLDNDSTPYLLVDATINQVTVPLQFVKDGRIVLNISPSAVRGLHIDNDALSFNARFSGHSMDVYVPIGAVQAIYSSENGEGMGFGMEPGVEAYESLMAEPMIEVVPEDMTAEQVDEMVEDAPERPARPSGRPALKVVK